MYAPFTPIPMSLSRRTFVAGGASTIAAIVVGPHRAMAQDATPPDMTGAAHPFSLGGFSCHAVSDGAFAGPGIESLLFAQSPQEVVDEVLGTRFDPAQAVAQKTSIVIDTGADLVLIDTGSGEAAGPNAGLLVENLQGAGIAPEDISVVVLTHGHADHVGGTVTDDGNATYPNARYVMSQEDWDFWSDEQTVLGTYPEEFAQGHLASFDQNLLPLEDVFELIGYDEEIVPGITSVAAQGHTPGHMGLRIESDGDMLWVLGDAALHPIDLQHPELAGVADAQPERMTETRQRLFEEIEGSGGMASFNHFDPFPSLGQVVIAGEAWRWQPVRSGATPVA